MKTEGITLYRLFNEMELPEPSKRDLSVTGMKIVRLYRELAGVEPEKVYQVENKFRGYVKIYPLEFKPVMVNIINSYLLEEKK